MPPESPLVTHGRWLRVGVFSLTMTLLAATAHLVAGGRLPGAGLTILAGLLVGCLAYPVAQRVAGIRAVLATTAAAQIVLHLAFALPMVPPPGRGVGAATGGTGLHMAMPVGSSGISIEHAWAALTADSPGLGMLAAHALAAVVLAVGLDRGERAVLEVSATVRSFVGTLVAVATGRLEPAVAVAPAPVRPALDLTELVGTLLAHSRWGRAPPVVRTR
jgi:hypothetical protein